MLGVTAVTGEFLLPQILDDFEREYPQVELILTEEKAGVLQDLVKKGKTDLAFMYQTDPELECHMIAENLVYIQVPLHLQKEKQAGNRESRIHRLRHKCFRTSLLFC